MPRKLTAPGYELQREPKIYVTALPGRWLLKRCTPSWRIRKPEKGFQRVVKKERAQAIAVAVLDQGRTFPNAIVLATNVASLTTSDGQIGLPDDIRLLVVDGQHRLWAQHFASQEATYACVIHTGLNEVAMAKLFLEINDNQKRVPSSLRWDLVRLVRPEDDEHAIKAAELVYELNKDTASPLHQRVDLTGEQPELTLKQGSLAPEFKNIVSTKKAGFKDLDFDSLYEVLRRYVAAIRSLDPDGWRTAKSPLYATRVFRVLLKLLPEVAAEIGGVPTDISTAQFKERLTAIRKDDLSGEKIRALQGSAGMKEIYELVKKQLGL